MINVSPNKTAQNIAVAFCNHGLRNSGGIERYLLTLVRGLHQRGIKPTVIAKKFDQQIPEYGWVKPVRLWVNWAPRKWRDFAFNWQLTRFKAKGRIFSPLIACNQTQAADIAICGSTHPGFLKASNIKPTWLDRRKISLERQHFENSHTVVAHSDLMRQQIIEFYGLSPEKIRLLYPPVDTGVFFPVDDTTRQALRKELSIPNDKPVFLLASTGHKRKGLDLLLSVFNHNNAPGYLVVAGRPIPATSSNVRYLGYRNDIQNIYRAVDFTIMASSFEPFGLVGIESVLCGTPVLLANGVGCGEVIRAPASINFNLPANENQNNHIPSFRQALLEATELWRRGAHRLINPMDSLSYNPSVATHLDALLSINELVSHKT